MLVQELIETWFQYKVRLGWSKKVREQVRRYSSVWQEIWEGLQVADIQREEVEAVEQFRNDGRRSASALNQEGVYMRGFFKWANILGYADKNPALMWPMRKVVVQKKYVVLDQEQEGALLEHSEEAWLRKFIVLAITTGQREGTVKLMRWDWVERTQFGPFLKIPAWAVKQRVALSVPIAGRAMRELGEPSEGVLVAGLPGAPEVWRCFRRAAAAAGLDPAVGPHDLRRTFVARCAEMGVPIEIVMKLGGWKSLSTVLKHYYGQVGMAQARKVSDQI